MNLGRFEKLLAKLPVRDKLTNASVPFVLNANQCVAMTKIKKQYEESKQLRIICCKSRRVGMSALIDAILFGHCLAREQAHAMIVAQLKDTSEKGLFRVPRDLGNDLNKTMEVCQVFKRHIEFFHSKDGVARKGNSLLDISTAGTAVGGRGLTLTALHLSEAALYPGDKSFLSILPAVSKGDDSIIAIESTAYGRTGIGQAFYDFWNRANVSGRGWNGYVPIFLSWLNDPECRRDPEEADDAPATDLERELMRKPWNATRGQIAWMRRVLESECDAQEPKFCQEYAWCAEVAFIATGDPAFPKKEMAYAISTKQPPIAIGHVVRREGKAKFEKSAQGMLKVWEWPQSKCVYYIGGDAAAGYESGDFAALVGWNGTTGKQAFSLAAHIHPEELAEQSDLLGRWYNDALLNIELTGNLGRWAQKHLRDNYFYPNLYIWKGKDDKKAGKDKSQTHGWETTSYSRGLMFDAFRECLRAGMKNLPGGIEIYDEELIRQMDIATLSEGMKWIVEKGHDDILCGALLCIVARAQYPPPNIMSYQHNVMESKESKHASVAGALKAQPDIRHALQLDLNFIMRKDRQRTKSTLGFI